MFRSTARSSSGLGRKRAYPRPSRRVLHSHSSPCLRQSGASITSSNRVQLQQKCTMIVLHSRLFSTTPTPHSTYRSRRVHRESIAILNRTSTGRVSSFTGSPPAANPATLRLAAKTQRARSVLESTKINKSLEPPAFLDYEPQKNKRSSVFFWSDEVNELDKRLMATRNYPPTLPKFKHDENQKIAKCHPSVWIASAHHLQMMHEGYDRIAFLGDSVAGKCLSDLLLNDYYCIAGVMAGLKSHLVSNAQFAYFSRIYNIPCKSNENAQGDAFEALVGALYLDGKRDGVDIDRIIYNWLKLLWEPWIELYINQLPQSQRDRVVSLHRAVPIGIAVATSDSPDSHQVMMAWESNIATYMIENRGKNRPKIEHMMLPSALTKEAMALQGPTVDAVGTSTAAPLDFSKDIMKVETKQLLQGKQKELEEKEKEEVTEVGEKNVKPPQDSSGAVWPTIKVTPEPTVSERHKGPKNAGVEVVQRAKTERHHMESPTPEARASQRTEAEIRHRKNEVETQQRVEAEIRRKQNEATRREEAERCRTESEALRRANEERRQREEERRKADALRQQEEEAARIRKEEAARIQKEEEARLIKKAKIIKEEKNLQNELASAKEEAEKARIRADEETEKAKKKLIENERPKTKAEKKAEQKAARLEQRMKLIRVEKMKIELAEAARSQVERVENEKAKKEQIKREKAEKAEREKAEKEKAEKEKIEKEKEAKERAEREKAEKEKMEKERAEKERVERDSAEKERVQRERECAERERTERKLVKEKAEKERAKRSELIAEKEAMHVKALADEEARLKWKRLLYDIDRMEERMIKQRELMVSNQPHMTELQKEQFKMSWQQYIDQQRGVLERQAGVEIGSTRVEANRTVKAEEEKTEGSKAERDKAEEEKTETAEEKPREQPESRSLWGRFWGALSGKN